MLKQVVVLILMASFTFLLVLCLSFRITLASFQAMLCLVSLTCLFTKIPLDDALQIISALLAYDDPLQQQTLFPAHDICHLTEHYLRTTYFSFEEQFFEQLEGVAMGSPLSPIVANLYKEGFERKALTLASVKPRMWIRYVDDTFLLWPHDDRQLETFHQHLNSLHPCINFTMEEETNNQIQFPDISVRRSGGTVLPRLSVPRLFELSIIRTVMGKSAILFVTSLAKYCISEIGCPSQKNTNCEFDCMHSLLTRFDLTPQ